MVKGDAFPTRRGGARSQEDTRWLCRGFCVGCARIGWVEFSLASHVVGDFGMTALRSWGSEEGCLQCTYSKDWSRGVGLIELSVIYKAGKEIQSVISVQIDNLGRRWSVGAPRPDASFALAAFRFNAQPSIVVVDSGTQE